MTFEKIYKKTIELITQHPKKDLNPNKPLLPHALRVGKYLYDNNYSDDIVNAGLLHDAIEWTDNSEEIIEKNFGTHVYNIVMANTKNRDIQDPEKRRQDYVDRCADVGFDALIVKAADTLDSYHYYKETGDDKEIQRSKHIAQLILEKANISDDPIFKKLSNII